jgi:hypothetical protein
MSQFSTYTEVIFDAFCLHKKNKEIIDRKQDIINKTTEFYNVSPDSFLFIGFNPAILSVNAKEIFVTEVSDRVFSWLTDIRPEIKRFEEIRKVDCIVAVDEYLTFAKTDQDQKDLVANLCNLATELIITTVKDYKNQDFKDREYSQPAIIKFDNSLTAYTEIHNWDMADRNSFITSTYTLNNNAVCSAVSNRRTMYFKQLAKFCLDAGATDFLVHRSLMFKSLIKKNYEHVISIRFEN